MADEVDASYEPDFNDIPKEDLLEVMRCGDVEATKACIQQKFGDINGLSHKLHTSSKKGIIGFKQGLQHRRDVFGSNYVPVAYRKSVLHFLLAAMTDWVIIVLVIGALISAILGGIFPEKCESEDSFLVAMYEGIGILITVLFMVLLIAVSDYVKENDFFSLETKIQRERKITVIRGGKVEQVLSKDVTVGDLCQINIGTLIPADGILVQHSDLVVNEATLTGQRTPVKKSQHSLVFCGTHAVDGSGRMIVMAVGSHTQLYIRKTQPLGTPTLVQFPATFTDEYEVHPASFQHDEDTALLQGKINKIQVALGHISIFLAVVVILVIVIRFSVYTFAELEMRFDPSHLNEYIRALIMGVIVLIIAVPEALSLVTSTSLAFCVKQMYKDKALVRHVDMIETMGNITNICCNKTGVLTKNRMAVAKSFIAEQAYDGDPRMYKKDIPKILFVDLCKAISINSSYSSGIQHEGEDGIPVQVGNKTDCALLQYLAEFGEYYESWRDDYPEDKLVKVYEFTPDRKCMTTVINSEDGGFKVYTKGAVEVLLEHCTSTVGIDGKLKEFTKEQAEDLSRDLIDPWQKEGLRILCLATRVIPVSEHDCIKREQTILSDLTLQGIVGLEDPVRDEVPDAIMTCQKAGITVRMVTGDNIITARSVALKCGIIRPNEENIMFDGEEFNSYIRDPDKKINIDRFDAMWPQLRVLARSSPLDKYLLVKGMMESHVKQEGEIVAVTGSGANDGPVLRMADVGFTMGVAGTGIAKEASDVILLNDDFSSIVRAIKWGRHVYNSILKFLQFQFTVCWVAVIVVIMGTCIFGRSPLVATQLLWINLIMDSLACLALTRDMPNDDLLKYKPYGRHKPLISRSLLRNVIGHSIYQLVVMFVLIFKGADFFDIKDGYQPNSFCRPSQHTSLVFTTFVAMQLFNEINSRMVQGRNVFQGIEKNYVFIIIWIAQVGIQILIVQFFHTAFNVEGMEWSQWMWCLFLGFSELIWAQVIFSVPKEVLPKQLRCVATGSGQGRGIAYYRSNSRVEQQDCGALSSLKSPAYQDPVPTDFSCTREEKDPSSQQI